MAGDGGDSCRYHFPRGKSQEVAVTNILHTAENKREPVKSTGPHARRLTRDACARHAGAAVAMCHAIYPMGKTE